jgi:predicted dehydrogenase
VALADILRDRLRSVPRLDGISQRQVRIAVQGFGAWTRDHIRPDFELLQSELVRNGHPGIHVTYLGAQQMSDLRDGEDLAFVFEAHERYIWVHDESTVADVRSVGFDLVIIATPDYSHVSILREWISYPQATKLILVEKPFADSSHEIIEFQRQLELITDPFDIPHIFGLDHYLLYVSHLFDQEADIEWAQEAGGSVEFDMQEEREIEPNRLRTLQSGLIFDMGAHFLALLALIASDFLELEPQVRWSGIHEFVSDELRDRAYFAETAAHVVFASDSEDRIAGGRFGKGVGKDLKALRLNPSGGGEVDVSLRANPALLCGKHGRLVQALIDGDSELFGLLLTIDECYKIVELLEQLRRKSLDLPVYTVGNPDWDSDPNEAGVA